MTISPARNPTPSEGVQASLVDVLRRSLLALGGGLALVLGLGGLFFVPSHTDAETRTPGPSAERPSVASETPEAPAVRVPFVEPPRDEPPATDAAARVLAVLDDVRTNLRDTRYQHTTVVNESLGRYRWDCSGMADWVLGKARLRRARAALQRSRPVARTFFETIRRAPTERSARGWERLTRIEDARPGDVFAWLRPPDWPRRNTGHVGFVVAAPRRVNAWPGAYVVRIADATSVPHQDDTRDGTHAEGGYGEGTILWMTDAGRALGYGWHGIHSRGWVETEALFGRLH